VSTIRIAEKESPEPVTGDGFLKSNQQQLIASCPAMRKLIEQVNIVGPHLRIASIEGESGSGKHTLAHLLFDRFAARRPEIRQWGVTRCDAREWLLCQTDLQSLAGFIYLDRVDLLAAPGQAILLRILKNLDFLSTGALVILASSESPLRELARNNQFLTELALRLTTVRLASPPLRDRPDDLIPLANLFLDRISARYNLQPIFLTSGGRTRLLEHRWPGNLRELSSTLESAVIECFNRVIRAEDLPLPASRSSASLPVPTPELLNLDAVIHHHLLRVLDLNRGNKLKTARQLGISRSTLYRLLEKRLSFS
jgi:DNA-binding NtrC family response regulator